MRKTTIHAGIFSSIDALVAVSLPFSSVVSWYLIISFL